MQMTSVVSWACHEDTLCAKVSPKHFVSVAVLQAFSWFEDSRNLPHRQVSESFSRVRSWPVQRPRAGNSKQQ
jgi:hypothetical protein